MRVSIVINNYNYARFLPDAIDSALDQDSGDRVEVIVVDDGSADNSREIIEGYGDRIKPIFKNNGGQASALNAGFVISSSDIVVFLDADDVLLRDASDTVRSVWQNGTARVHYPLEVMDAHGELLGRRVGGSAIPDVTLGPFGVNSPTSGNAFSRAVLERVMPIPEPEWRICADVFLTAACSLFGRTISLDRPLGKYRVHGTNNIAGASQSVAAIRRAIADNLNLYASLYRLAPERIGSREEWLGAYPQHWVGRITSLRESSADHPWPDRVSELMRKAILATWRQPYWSVRRKLAYSAWILVYGVAPKRLARGLKRIEERGADGLPSLLPGR